MGLKAKRSVAPSRSSPPSTEERRKHGFQSGQRSTSAKIAHTLSTGSATSVEPAIGSGAACAISLTASVSRTRMGGRARRTGIGALTALAVLVAAATAQAIPWDAGGAIVPADTPPAKRPDPSCAQSYANDRARRGPSIRFGIGPRLAGE